MHSRLNRRGCEEHYTDGHLKLSELKVRAQHLKNKYLSNKYIPNYPQPEFHASYLKHDTNVDGLFGIIKDSGFKNPFEGSLLWWSLRVGPEEIADAEKRPVETYSEQTGQVQLQDGFLEKFATSPAFLKTSRLGSYRFTFPVEEVLKAYSDQFCAGRPPVMKVFKTVLYKQEVMYVVLVHSPEHEEMYSHLPELTDDTNAICSYKRGRFTWRSQAMCETHRFKLVKKDDEERMEAEEVKGRHRFYVWDNVSIALHVDDQVLTFDEDQLKKALTLCSESESGIKLPDVKFENEV